MIRPAIVIALLLAVSLKAFAQGGYPEKPIRFIVGFPAGSSVDAAARIIAPRLAESLGAPVLIENIVGAAGNIASERVVHAAPDGHTLAFVANAQIITNPSLYRLTYEPASAFAPISQLVALPNILVVPAGSSAKSFPELIAQAKAKPGVLTYASGGVGSSPHMAGALLNAMAGINVQHIPYKGVVAALPDLLAGRLSMMFSPISIVLPSVHEGRLRPLATASLKRTSSLPDLPSIAESGLPGFEVTVWLGLLAPAGTPAQTIDRLHQESVKALVAPDVSAKLNNLGMDIIGNSPDEFAAIIKSEVPFWANVIKQAGIKLE